MAESSDVAANVREILELARNGNSLTQKPEAVIDPTANVLSLVAAANLRQDDLRNKRQGLARPPRRPDREVA